MVTKKMFYDLKELNDQLKIFQQMGGYVINPLGRNNIDLEVGEVLELPCSGKFQILSGIDKNGKPYGLKQFGVLYSNKEYFITVPEEIENVENLRCRVSTYISKSGKEVKTFEYLPSVYNNIDSKKSSLIAENIK